MLLEAITIGRVGWAAVTVAVCALVARFLKEWGKNRPPGPRGLPVVGYIPFLSEMEHLDFWKLQKTYGKIISLKMGIRRTVVLGDFKAIKDAFNQEAISERPPKLFEVSGNVTHFVEMEGRDWKESRRFVLSSLRTLGMGKNKLADVVTEEGQSILRSLHKYKTNEDINLADVLYPAVARFIISLICGKDLNEDKDFSSAVDVYGKSFFPYMRIKAYLCFLPLLKPFVSFLFPDYKTLEKDVSKLEHMLWNEIQLQEDHPEEFGSQNYMAHFLDEIRKASVRGNTFTRNVLNGNCQIMLVAGFDTTLTTLQWTFMLLAQYQDVQEKVYREIVQVIGKERPPVWNERDDFPYLDAVLAEVSRFKTIVPLADPHWVTSDTTLGEYNISKGTVVLGNIYAVHNDPELWDRPETFNPDRFMTSDGKRAKDPEFLIPFSIGKRFCPGEKLARMEMFLFVCTILQHFRVLPPSSGLDMEGTLDIVFHPKKPFVRVQARE